MEDLFSYQQNQSTQNPKEIFSVSEVTSDIKLLLEDNFASIWIEGEISNLKISANGHGYFSLKDDEASLSSVIFRGNLNQVKFDLEDGLKVNVRGRVSVYEPRGQYQLIIDQIEPCGLGELQLAFEQLKKKLTEEGLFNEEFKKLIPYLPNKIALITSSKGSVIHDIQNVISRRYEGMSLLICPTPVQGVGAGNEIAKMIELVNLRDDIDLIILARGGGSIEDLWAFNEEVVVRAIFNSNIPIISGVGHETDTTLADFVADLRAPTPSAAAELAVPEKLKLIEEIAYLKNRLKELILDFFKNNYQNIEYLKSSFKDPKIVLENYYLKIDDLISKLVLSEKELISKKNKVFREYQINQQKIKSKLSSDALLVYQYQSSLEKNILKNLNQNKEDYLMSKDSILNYPQEIKNKIQKVDFQYQRLKDLSPFFPLKRGYGLVRLAENKKSIKDISLLKLNQDIEVILDKGKFKARVSEINEEYAINNDKTDS
jgi:exodeoxyribonuclease VII large subunit